MFSAALKKSSDHGNLNLGSYLLAVGMARIRTGREAGIIECHSNGHLSSTCKEVIDMSYKSVKSEIS